MTSVARVGNPLKTYGVRVYLASSSRSGAPSRTYATESRESSREPSAGGYGFTTDKREETAIIKKWRGPGIPFLNSLRNRVSIIHPHLWKGQPFRELTVAKRKTGGRDHTGRIVVRHIGGGHKRRLRTLDFYRFESGIHDVIRIEYDPGRSGHIALLKRRHDSTADVDVESGARLAEEVSGPKGIKAALKAGDSVATGGEISTTIRHEFEEQHRSAVLPSDDYKVVKGGWSYILAPEGLRAGDSVRSFRLGVPDGFVEGWNQIETEDGTYIDTNPASPQSINSPALDNAELKPKLSMLSQVTPRALALLRTEALKPGNVLPLYLIPPGTIVHNITLNPTSKMRLARSAGVSAEVVTHQNINGDTMGGLDVLNIGGHMMPDGRHTKHTGWVIVRMSSGEVRKIVPGAVATIGRVSNKEKASEVLGKAGRARWLGHRPRVRGVAMNAHDHPMGGGRGKSKGGKQSTSIYGWTSKGRRTRRPADRDGNKLVVKERPRRLGRKSGRK